MSLGRVDTLHDYKDYFVDVSLGANGESLSSFCIIVDGIGKQIKRDKHNDFWIRYCDDVKNGIKRNIKQSIIEVSQLVITINEMLEGESVTECVQKIKTYLEETILFDRLSDNYNNCVVTRSKSVTSIYFPCIRLNTEAIYTKHLPSIQKILNKDILIPGLADPVPLYGSDDRVVVEIDEKNDVEDDYGQYSPAYHTKVFNGLIDEKIFSFNADIIYWLPLTLTLDYWYSISSERPIDTIKKKKTRVYDLDVILSDQLHTGESVGSLDDHIMFINMWTAKRVIDPRYCKILGAVFCTLTSGHQRGLNAWIKVITEASKDLSKSNADIRALRKDCESVYTTFTIGSKTIRSLAYYAKIDSPRKYFKWHDNWVNDALVKSLPVFGRQTPCEGRIAEVYYRLRWLEYLSGDDGVSVAFYKHRNHKLIKDYKGISIRTDLSNSFLSLYVMLRLELTAQGALNMAHSSRYEIVLSAVSAVITSLNKQSFKRDMLSALEEKFRVDNIMNLLDNDMSLTGTLNGVMVASTNSIYFREGMIEDYITKSTKVNYRQDYTWDHPDVQDAIEWSLTTFAYNMDMVSFFWLFLSSLLLGGNNDKKLILWSGPSNGGKSSWEEEIIRILGSYAGKMPINYFTQGKATANAASPAEASIVGTRIVFSEEPDENVPLLVHLIKTEVGNDTRKVRDVYEKSRDVFPQHKTVIVCNEIPPMHKEDASVDRVLVLPFLIKYVYGAPKTLEERIAQKCFPRDPFFNRKIAKLGAAVFWIMVNNFDTYTNKGGLGVIPEIVKVSTDKYWDSNDRFKLFIDDNIVQNIEKSIDLYDVVDRFSEWHTKNYKKLHLPSREKIVKGLEEKLGKPIDNAFQSYSFVKNHRDL